MLNISSTEFSLTSSPVGVFPSTCNGNRLSESVMMYMEHVTYIVLNYLTNISVTVVDGNVHYFAFTFSNFLKIYFWIYLACSESYTSINYIHNATRYNCSSLQFDVPGGLDRHLWL